MHPSELCLRFAAYNPHITQHNSVRTKLYETISKEGLPFPRHDASFPPWRSRRCYLQNHYCRVANIIILIVIRELIRIADAYVSVLIKYIV